MILRIAGYCRISVDEEMDRDNTSIENQKAIIEDYVRNNFRGAELNFYCDRDRSGYTFEQREEYQRLRRQLLDGTYKILIIKDFSRFSRRNSKGLVELEDLRDAGVRIISIGDSIDYPTYDDWTAIQFRFLINEMPVTDTSKKVKNVIRRRQSDGKWICSVPYGYIITDSKKMLFEVDEAAAEVVRTVFDLYNKGWGYKKIANYLTDSKIPTPRMCEKARKDALGIENKIKARSVWSIVTVQGIIENDFYIGTLRQAKYKRKKINGADVKNDVSEHIVFEKNHEAIVDEKVFAMAQEQLKKRTRSNYRGIKKYDTHYSGFLFCGDCGSPMFSMSRGDLAPAYVCGTYHKRGLKGCTSHHTRVDMLDGLIKSYLRIVRDNSLDMLKELEKSIKDEPDYLNKNTNIIDKLQEELDGAKLQLKNLSKQKLRELTKRPEHADSIEELYDEMEKELLETIEGIKSQISMNTDRRNNIININRKAKTVIDIFNNILVKDKLDKTDLSYIIEKIVIYEDHIDIRLKSDIDTLLRLNTERKPEENSPNFNLDIDKKNSSQYILTQKTRNQRAKIIGVNVISDGDPLEIFTDREGEIILKKYSPIGELGNFAKEYAESLAQNAGHIACIVDKDHIIAVSGGLKKELLEKQISGELEEAINRRNTLFAHREENDFVPILENEEDSKYKYELISPIICEGDVLGAVVMLSENDKLGEVEGKLVETAAVFLGKQMEQ
ncbi:MAG: recombinase family protein [Clostridiales bacterium]|nr:recombinase family protein [Clostridiales bacterium]